MPTREELKFLQALPLEVKILKTKARIREWITHFGVDGVYVSFSGGKDSTVLLDLVRQEYPTVQAVFADTGLEYPEIRDFVKGYENVVWVKPKMRFDEVIKKYGYPIISKEVARGIDYGKKWLANGSPENYGTDIKKILGEPPYDKNSMYNNSKYKPLLDLSFNTTANCCAVMKKTPFKTIKKTPITGTTAEESKLRMAHWVKQGCNAFDNKKPISNPLSFWTNQDILEYIKTTNLKIATVYGDIVDKDTNTSGQMCMSGCERFCTTGLARTGCMFCLFGMHLEKGETRLQKLHKTHPKIYNYCMNGGEFVSELWQPNSKGLGMKYVCDKVNELMEKDLLRY